jgi:PKD repeat protein
VGLEINPQVIKNITPAIGDRHDYQYAITGLAGSKEYYVRIRAEQEFGVEEKNTVYCVGTTLGTAIDNVGPIWSHDTGIISTVQTDTSLKITWQKADDVMSPTVRYNLYYSMDSPLNYDIAEKNAGLLLSPDSDGIFCYELTGLTLDRIYQIAVRAEDAVGNEESNQVIKPAEYHYNHPPQITSLSITPATAYVNSTLIANLSASDNDGDSISYLYQWYKDGGILTNQTTSNLSGCFVKHNLIKVEVIPFDGQKYGEMKSCLITIQNSIPTRPTVDVLPNVAYTTDELAASVNGSTDADGDTISYQYEWYRNGNKIGSLTGSTVPAAQTIRGDRWVCIVTPGDGESTGSNSQDAVTIRNTPPSPPVFHIIPSHPADLDDLVVDFPEEPLSQDVDGDTIQYPFQWYKSTNGGYSFTAWPGQTNGFLSNALTKVGDIWRCVITPYDGIDYGQQGVEQVSIGTTSGPQVTVSADSVAGNLPLTVTFTVNVQSGNASVVGYEWDFDGNGIYDWSSQISGKAIHTYTSEGTYPATIAVKDSNGMIGTGLINITVTRSSDAPEAKAYASVTTGTAPLTVELTGNALASNPIQLYMWDFDGDGNYDWVNTSTGQVTHTYSQEGLYSPTFMVMDIDGQSDTDKVSITVQQGTGVPQASLVATPTTGSYPLTISYTANATDSNGQILVYLWDFNGDGAFDLAKTTDGGAQYTFTSPGTFKSKVRVIDDSGLSKDAEKSVVINQPEALAVWITTPEAGSSLEGESASILAETSMPGRTKLVSFEYRVFSKNTSWQTIGSDSVSVDGFSLLWTQLSSVLSSGDTCEIRAIAWDIEDNMVTSQSVTVSYQGVSPSLAIKKRVNAYATNPIMREWTSANGDHYKTQHLYAAQNNTIRLYDGAQLFVPYGALTADEDVTIGVLTSQYVYPGITKYRGVIHSIAFTDSNQDAFIKSVRFKLLYPDMSNDGIVDGTIIQENTLKMASHESTNNSWTYLVQAQLVPDENYLSLDIVHPGEFRIQGGSDIDQSIINYPALKLLSREVLSTPYCLEDYSPVKGCQYTLMNDMGGQVTLSSSTVRMTGLSYATTEMLGVKMSYGIDTLTGNVPVKIASYRLTKLPHIGIRAGENAVLNLSGYCYSTAERVIPPSFGSASALVVSDTTLLRARWIDSSNIEISALSGFTVSGWVDVIASPVTSNFGIDIDKERIYVYPNLLNIGKFTTFNDIWHYGLEKTTDKANYPAISFLTTTNDGSGAAQANVMCFNFTSTNQGIKMTPQFSSMVQYKANSWYIARMKVCSPTVNNDLQSQLYHYNGVIPDNAHIDISANIYFGTPTTWSWIETPLYATTTGTGYPQLMLKAGDKIGKLYLAEVQVFKAVPTLYNSTRSKHTLGYAYSNFSSLSYLAMGWSTTECFDNGTSKPALSVTNPGVLTVNFNNAPSDGKSMKFTAWNGNTQKIYTPASTPNSEIGMKADVNIASGSFDSYNAMVFLGCYGVATNGSYDFYSMGGQLAAMAEFGTITNGTHYLAAPGRNGYHQMQFVLKNNENGILNIQNVDFLRDTDDPYFGDMSLFP